jgi:hypothetical protein
MLSRGRHPDRSWTRELQPSNVRFWHKADITIMLSFGGKADINGRQSNVCF